MGVVRCGEAPELQAVHVEEEQRAVHIEEVVGGKRDPITQHFELNRNEHAVVACVLGEHVIVACALGEHVIVACALGERDMRDVWSIICVLDRHTEGSRSGESRN